MIETYIPWTSKDVMLLELRGGYSQKGSVCIKTKRMSSFISMRV